MALPLYWDRMPGYTGVVAAEERAGGIEGEGPAGVVDNRMSRQLARQSGERLPVASPVAMAPTEMASVALAVTSFTAAVPPPCAAMLDTGTPST